MPAEEQIRRNQLLQDRLRRYDVNRWADEFVQALLSTQKTEAARRAREAHRLVDRITVGPGGEQQ